MRVFFSRFMREIFAHQAEIRGNDAGKGRKTGCFADLRLVASSLLRNMQIEQTLEKIDTQCEHRCPNNLKNYERITEQKSWGFHSD